MLGWVHYEVVEQLHNVVLEQLIDALLVCLDDYGVQ